MLILHGDISCETCFDVAEGTSPLASFGTCVQNPAERLPTAATPLLQLHLAPDHVAGRGGIDLDARKRRGKRDTAQRLRLLDDVFSRKVVAALLEDLFKDHALHVAGEVAGVLE